MGRHIGEPLCARCTGWPLAGILLSLLHGRSGLCTHCTDEKPKAQVKRLSKVPRQPEDQGCDLRENVSNSRVLLTSSH